MNIVISLDCSSEQTANVLDGIKSVLSAQGLEITAHELAGTTVIHGTLQVMNEPAVEPEIPSEPMGDPVGIPPEVTVPEPEVSVTPNGIVAMVNMSPMEPAPEVSPEEPKPAPAFGDVRVLTLSTSYFIPSTVVPSHNTVLKVLGLTVSEGIVRFTFNGFEHALPAAETNAMIITNTSHTSGPSTVRLVIDIANKTYPCLIDVEPGDREELLIGDDLIPAIVEVAENVSTE